VCRSGARALDSGRFPPMNTASQGPGCGGRLVILLGIAALGGILWHARQEGRERRLTNLGAEVVYTRGERAALLATRLQSSTTGRVASTAPRVVDRLFGRLVAVHFGRTADLRGSDPDAVVRAVVAMPHIRTVLIDGVPLDDAGLLRLVEAPALTELGLKNTGITAAGVDAARARRPGLQITWIDAP